MDKLIVQVFIWSLVIMFMLFIPSCSTAGTYQLKVLSEYTAFSGDLDLQYIMAEDESLPNAFIRLILITDDIPKVINNFGIDSKYKTGTVKVTCGIYIEVAGKYEFQLHMYSGGPILTRAELIVRWPEVTMQLPELHMVQSSAVTLRINSSATCNPVLRRFEFNVELEYAKNNSGMLITGNQEVLYSHSFSNFTSIVTIQFPCSLFDTTGIYRASLKSSFSAISVVSRSNSMITSPNPAYKINIYTDTIFPCNNIIDVNYLQAQCPGAKDKHIIRMFMLRRKSSGSLASPLEKIYIQERFADPDQSYITVNCSMFVSSAAGYCFQYVTIGRDGGIVNQTELCLSAHPDSVLPIDGGWSRWTPWSRCSSDCGSGQQRKYRMCDSPTPNFGGAFCNGDSIQFKSCDVFCPESIPFTPLHSPKVTQACACGCNMKTNEGEIIASGRCERTSRWLITVLDNHFIKLKFKYLNLYKNKQWVKVRNGATLGSDLIAYSDGRNEILDVKSTSNKILVEFYSESDTSGGVTNSHNSLNGDDVALYPLVATKPIHVHGFIASFTSNESAAGLFPLTAKSITVGTESSIWESTVTIVGIAACGLVVITALIFVIYHRTCHRRHHKYAMAAHEDSPKRMCKSTSMGSSPSHESHHGIEIEHDMEVPLTNAANGDKRKAKTPGSTKSRTSASSACSNNKKVRTKVDIEYKGGSHRCSPLTPRGEYHQIPQVHSPRKMSRAQEVSQECETTNMSLFRTSPLLKTKVPRSPKVHPSPKLKNAKTPKTPTNSSPAFNTKHELLSKRFDTTPRDNQRVVMGSDYTPTSSIKSPPSDSYKTDCDTPTNINNVIYRKQSKQRGHETPDNGVNSLNGIIKPGDIKLTQLDKTDDDNDRKPASGTSDDSTSAEKETGSQMTTSFIENGGKPRRPTSLTESYSKMSLASSNGGDVIKSIPESSKDKTSVTSSDDRQKVLPKPDGQSPKSPRVETVKIPSKNSSPLKTQSKNSTPKSVRSLRSDQTDSSSKNKSPARSINTPSDVDALEYDDFVDMDDTYSYFDPVVTEQLTWHGSDNVKSKTPKEEQKS